MSFPQPEITVASAPYWSGLRDGRLLYQHCRCCAHSWLPPREFCPSCLASEFEWRQASGLAKVISWVVYHIAYDDAFKNRLPYNVTCIELDEGPRMLTNVVDCEAGRRLRIGAPVHLAIEYEGDLALARFRLNPRGSSCEQRQHG